MDERAAKLAAARQKLKHHQEKKIRTEYTKVPNENDLPKDLKSLVNSKPIQANADVLQSVDCNNSPAASTEFKKNNINVTEILISDKARLETQVKELEMQLMQLQHNYSSVVEHQNIYMQTISRLEMELETIKSNYTTVTEESLFQKKVISDIQNKNTGLTDENNNLLEQLEFTKTVLTSKENENIHFKEQNAQLQNQLDTLQLQIKQLTSDPNANNYQKVEDHTQSQLKQDQNEKISNLQEQLQALKKERDNLSSHYEHYVNELNLQIKATTTKNISLNQEMNQLYHREDGLIDQISELEKRLQTYQSKAVTEENVNSTELEDKIKQFENKYQELSVLYNELQEKYNKSQEQIKTLSESHKVECDKDNISMSKLNADIASDKIAAQRATEQNKKLKTDLEELEFAFVKMSKDKLELTEKLTHEKQLSKELMLKLADIEENAKGLHSKIMAKDDEMIRLQNSYRILEKDHEQVLLKYQHLKKNEENHIVHDTTDFSCDEKSEHILNGENQESYEEIKEGKEVIENNNEDLRMRIAKEDAMLKLQERFLNIMDEVASLSDEKHRLEHIILQLQNETDTICEYITLYQQQRSLLKKRDEERSEQIKMFQIESNKLRSYLEQLNNLLLRFANDEDLIRYLHDESRKNDISKVMELLANLKNSSLITSNHKNLDFKNFYPCNCCTGQIIDI